MTVNPWILNKTVLPQNTDYFGVMWHGSYINWFEEARIEALSKAGIKYCDLSSMGYEMPVVDLKISFRAPLKNGDKAILKSWLLKKQHAKLPWRTIVFDSKDNICVEAHVNIVLVKKFGGNMKLIKKTPDFINKAIIVLQNGHLH